MALLFGKKSHPQGCAQPIDRNRPVASGPNSIARYVERNGKKNKDVRLCAFIKTGHMSYDSESDVPALNTLQKRVPCRRFRPLLRYAVISFSQTLLSI